MCMLYLLEISLKHRKNTKPPKRKNENQLEKYIKREKLKINEKE